MNQLQEQYLFLVNNNIKTVEGLITYQVLRDLDVGKFLIDNRSCISRTGQGKEPVRRRRTFVSIKSGIWEFKRNWIS